MRQIILWILIVCLPAAKALADNAHDHLIDLPTAKELMVAKDAIFKMKLKDMANGDFHRFIGTILDINPDARSSNYIFDGIDAKGGYEKITVGEFCAIIGNTPEEGFAKLLTVRNVGENRTGAYLSITPMRNVITDTLPIDSLRLVYREVFKNMAAAAERKAIVTIGLHPNFLGSDNQRLKAITEEAKAAGVDLKLLAGIPRKNFLIDYQAPGSRQIGMFEELVKAGLIHGVDITGSLLENARDSADPGRVKEGLLRLMKYCSDRKLILRIHAFERVSEGPFYEGLEAAIREFDGPLELHIGHIRKINDRWFKEVLSLPKRSLRIIINACVVANSVLFGDSAQTQAAQVAKARAVGLPVWIGPDGRGTYNRSEYSAAVERLVDGERGLTFPLRGYPTSAGGFNSACFKVGAAAGTGS